MVARLWQALRAVPYGMQARADARGSPLAIRLGLHELRARALRTWRALRRDATATPEVERQIETLPLHTRLRSATALIALPGGILLTLLELRYATAEVVGQLSLLGLV